jgi:arsenate reductase
MEVQVFGVRKSADTRTALRFFALRRFAERFGAAELVDRDGRRFRDLGLAAARLGDAAWLDRLAADPLLLRMPLVRAGTRLTVGAAEDVWRAWVEER